MRQIIQLLTLLTIMAFIHPALGAPEIQHGPSTGGARAKAKSTGMAITGNLEMPKLLRTIPWQRADRSVAPRFSPLGEKLEPVDPVILRRKTELRQWLNQNLQ